MKEVSLFCSYEIHQACMLQIMFFGVFGKISTRRGTCAWFHDVVVQKFLNIE
jgi:hypothetical protein